MVFYPDPRPPPPFIYTTLIAVKTFLLLKHHEFTKFLYLCSEIYFFFEFIIKNFQQWYLLGRTSSEVFVMLVVIFILLLFFICRCSSFTFSFGHHPSPLRGLSPGFHNHFVLSAQPIAEWFGTRSFSTVPLSSYRHRYGFEWAFFNHRCFLPYAPSRHFLAQPAFIKASLEAGSYSLKFAGLHTDPRNTDPVHLLVWFTVIHNLLYILYLY